MMPDGSRIVTGSEHRTARIWKLSPSGQALVDEAKAAIPRGPTIDERERNYLAPEVPEWYYSMRKWPYDPASLMIAGKELLAAGKFDEARAKLAKAGKQDSSLAARRDSRKTILLRDHRDDTGRRPILIGSVDMIARVWGSGEGATLWADEVHPTDAGYKLVAAKFGAGISEALARRTVAENRQPQLIGYLHDLRLIRAGGIGGERQRFQPAFCLCCFDHPEDRGRQRIGWGGIMGKRLLELLHQEHGQLHGAREALLQALPQGPRFADLSIHTLSGFPLFGGVGEQSVDFRAE